MTQQEQELSKLKNELRKLKEVRKILQRELLKRTLRVVDGGRGQA